MNETLDLLKLVGSLGVGGVLAGMVFFFYRVDARDARRHLADVIAQQRQDQQHCLTTIASNTEVLTLLRVTLEQHTRVLERFLNHLGDRGASWRPGE